MQEEQHPIKEIDISSTTYDHPECKNLLIKGANLEFQEEQYDEKQMKDLYEQTKNQKEYVQQEAINKCLSDIRWKFNLSKEVISNARIVEWEDGSFSLMVGDRHYELNINKQQNTNDKPQVTKLFTNHHSGALVSQQDLNDKCTLKLSNQQS